MEGSRLPNKLMFGPLIICILICILLLNFNNFVEEFGTKIRKRNEKGRQKNIIIKYKQYLKLEKSLSANTVEAYLTDLDKLFAFLELENIHFTDVTLENLETFSAGLRDIGIHPRSQARILSGIRSFSAFFCLKTTYSKTRQNYWNRHKSANTCPMC